MLRKFWFPVEGTVNPKRQVGTSCGLAWSSPALPSTSPLHFCKLQTFWPSLGHTSDLNICYSLSLVLCPDLAPFIRLRSAFQTLPLEGASACRLVSTQTEPLFAVSLFCWILSSTRTGIVPVIFLLCLQHLDKLNRAGTLYVEHMDG